MGNKTFFNNTDSDIIITLVVRFGDNPWNNEETHSFTVEAGQELDYDYGDQPYLNSLELRSSSSPDDIFGVYQVESRGDDIDDRLNTRRHFEIYREDNTLTF